jgi:hypothetical protein
VGESASVRGVWVCEAVWVTTPWWHGSPGGRVDGRRLARLRPGRGTRIALSVPNHGALRDRTRKQQYPRSTTSSIRCSSRRTRGSPSHALFERHRSSAPSSSRGRGGTPVAW